MEFTAKQIAEVVGGTIVGDENAVVHAFAKIEEGQPGALSFLANEKLTAHIYTTAATIVLVDDSITLTQPVAATIIRVANAYASMAQLLHLYESLTAKKEGIDPLAFIATTATVGSDVYVGAFAYVGEGAVVEDGSAIYPYAYVGDHVRIGAGSTLYPHAVVYHDCHIGRRVVLHAGSVVGADGFGFTPTADGYEKIPQIGTVTIEDDVEVGANTCIDRATLSSTTVRQGVKLDNLVQIAHNTDIGPHTVMSAQVGIAGSTRVGAWCAFAGQVGITGHIDIGDHVALGAKTGVPSSIKSGQALIGIPPMPQRPYFKMLALQRRLPDLYQQVQTLEKEVARLREEVEKSRNK